MLKSTSHRSIQHAKITKKPQYKNQIERKHTFRAFFLIKPILFFRRFINIHFSQQDSLIKKQYNR